MLLARRMCRTACASNGRPLPVRSPVQFGGDLGVGEPRGEAVDQLDGLGRRAGCVVDARRSCDRVFLGGA
jgi:hypothetical protein